MAVAPVPHHGRWRSMVGNRGGTADCHVERDGCHGPGGRESGEYNQCQPPRTVFAPLRNATI